MPNYLILIYYFAFNMVIMGIVDELYRNPFQLTTNLLLSSAGTIALGLVLHIMNKKEFDL